MNLFLKTPPINEPLTIAEVQAYLRLPENQEEDFLPFLIASARAYVEGFTGRSLIRQQWQLEIHPPYPVSSPLVQRRERKLMVALSRPPLLEVASVMAQGKEVPFTVEDHKVVLSSTLWDHDLTLLYWAGYGEEASSLPPDLKMAVLMATRFLYDQQPCDLPLLHPYKVYGVG